MRGVFLLSLIFLACEGICDTTTSEPSTSSYEGSADYTTPEPDPCSNYNCSDNAYCQHDDDEQPYCVCEDGYIKDGKECVKGCNSVVQAVSSSLVNPDVENCTNATLNDMNSYNISVFFEATAEGKSVLANVTCNKTCDGTGTQRSIGVIECQAGGSWSAPTWTDCSKTESELTTDEKLTNALIDTTNPGDIDDDTVYSTVEVLAEVASETNITQDTADDFMETTNNLLLATDSAAEDAVEDESASLLESINNLANHVVLENSDDGSYGKYQSEESNIALAVVGDSTTKSPAAPKAEDADIYYYGFNGDWDESYNLAASGLQITTMEPNGSYIKGSRTGDEVLSFQMYSQVNQVFSGEVDGLVAVNVIYAVNGSTSFTMNFRISRNIQTDSNNKFNITTKGNMNSYEQLQCIRWNINATEWDVNDRSCGTYSAANYSAKCTCSTPGQYTMRTLTITYDDGDDGDDGDDSLSGGEIAGIVIGCLAGVALIAAGVVYFMKKQKKRKGKHSSGYDNASMSSL